MLLSPRALKNSHKLKHIIWLVCYNKRYTYTHTHTNLCLLAFLKVQLESHTEEMD